jgi:hypothetical protein
MRIIKELPIKTLASDTLPIVFKAHYLVVILRLSVEILSRRLQKCDGRYTPLHDAVVENMIDGGSYWLAVRYLLMVRVRVLFNNDKARETGHTFVCYPDHRRLILEQLHCRGILEDACLCQ